MKKVKIPLSKALPLARKIVATLAPACDGDPIIAGSVRRRRPMVGDIEIVAIPQMLDTEYQLSLLGEATPPPQKSALEILLEDDIIHRENIRVGDKWGFLYKNLIIQTDVWGIEGQEIGLDLFTTTPPQWGYIVALRTGPHEFNRAWVTQRSKGGLLPDRFRFAGGWLYDGETRIDTPDERGLFDLIGVPWIEPEQRDDWRRLVKGIVE